MQKYRYLLIGCLGLFMNLGLTGALASYLTMGGYLMFMSLLPGIVLFAALFFHVRHEAEGKEENRRLGLLMAAFFEASIMVFANYVFDFKTVDGVVLKMTATNFVSSFLAYALLALLAVHLGSRKKKN